MTCLPHNYKCFSIQNNCWESAEILKLIITNFKSIDNQLKSVEIIKSINVETSSHLMIKKASYHFHL